MSEPDALRRFGRMAGILFIAGALLPVPSTLLLEPRPELASYSITAAAVLTGLACLLLPWERARVGWLHCLALAATLEVAATVALFDLVFGVMYLLIGILVAYGFGRPRDAFPHVVLISMAMLAPVVYDPDASREALQLALLLVPSVWMLAGALVFLRTQVDTRERAYRHFAEQALSLTERIAGGASARPAGTLVPARSLAKREPQPPASRRSWWRPALAVIGGLFAVPLGFAGLAAAGVQLPGAIAEPFESVGLELPNQGGDDGDDAAPADRAAPVLEVPQRSGRAAATAPSGSSGDGDSPGKRSTGPGDDGTGAAAGSAPAGTADWSPATDPVAPTASPLPPAGSSPSSGGGDGSGTGASDTGSAAGDVVRGAGTGLETLLGGALGNLSGALEETASDPKSR